MTAPSDEVGHPPPGIEGSRTDAPQQFDARRIPLLLWAKLGKASKGELAEPLPYHPLLCHCLDVAAVAEALWRECLAPAARHWLAGGLGLDDEEAGRWVAFLAGLHDVGKCAPAFQFQFRREAVRRLLRPRARAAGLDWHPGVEGQNRPRHGTITAKELPALLRGRGLDWESAARLGRVVGAHHGVFATSIELNAPS